MEFCLPNEELFSKECFQWEKACFPFFIINNPICPTWFLKVGRILFKLRLRDTWFFVRHSQSFRGIYECQLFLHINNNLCNKTCQRFITIVSILLFCLHISFMPVGFSNKCKFMLNQVQMVISFCEITVVKKFFFSLNQNLKISWLLWTWTDFEILTWKSGRWFKVSNSLSRHTGNSFWELLSLAVFGVTIFSNEQFGRKKKKEWENDQQA